MKFMVTFVSVVFFTVSGVLASSPLQDKLAQKKEATEKLRNDVLDGKEVNFNTLCSTQNSCSGGCDLSSQ